MNQPYSIILGRGGGREGRTAGEDCRGGRDGRMRWRGGRDGCGEGWRGTMSACVRVHRAPSRAPGRVWGCALIQGHPGSRQGGQSVSWERPPNTNRPLLTLETGAGGGGGGESGHPAKEAQTARTAPSSSPKVTWRVSPRVPSSQPANIPDDSTA